MKMNQTRDDTGNKTTKQIAFDDEDGVAIWFILAIFSSFSISHCKLKHTLYYL